MEVAIANLFLKMLIALLLQQPADSYKSLTRRKYAYQKSQRSLSAYNRVIGMTVRQTSIYRAKVNLQVSLRKEQRIFTLILKNESKWGNQKQGLIVYNMDQAMAENKEEAQTFWLQKHEYHWWGLYTSCRMGNTNCCGNSDVQVIYGGNQL